MATVVAVGLAALGSLVVAAPAPAAAPVEFAFTFDSGRPGAPSDATLHLLYKDPAAPDDPYARPPALTRVVIEAPEGTVFDGSAVPACEASDEELTLLGRGACPPASDVGGGFGSVSAGLPAPFGPISAEAALFNYGAGIIELFPAPGTDVGAVVDRARFEGPRTMVLEPPPTPGIAPRQFLLRYRGARGAGGEAFITTPPTCPADGLWTSRLTYSVETGATYTAESTTPCLAPPAAPSARSAAIRATVRPRRVRAGRRAHVRVRLRSAERRCVRGARVRIDGGRPVRADGAGRATLVRRFGRPGPRTVVATKPGCRTGRATLRVLPAR